MPEHNQLLGLAAPLAVLIAAAVVLPAPALAEHENRYFGFGYRPYVAPQYPPVVYPPPPRVRETAPGVYEYEVAPGRWMRMRTGPGYEPPRRSVRTPPSQVARPEPSPPPVPKSKPDLEDEPSVAVRDAPTTITLEPVREEPLREEPSREEPVREQAAPQPAEQTPEQILEQTPEQTAARSPEQVETSSSDGLSCDAAADIVETFGFSDVQATSCSGDVYGFDASRDGSSFSIRVSAANGELTEVRRR